MVRDYMIDLSEYDFKEPYCVVELKTVEKTDSGILLNVAPSVSARFIEFGTIVEGKNKGATCIFNKSTSKPFQYQGLASDNYFICKSDTDIIAIHK